MYKILRDNKRYNTKSFESYEAARKYVRRLITKLAFYTDAIGWAGFSIKRV